MVVQVLKKKRKATRADVLAAAPRGTCGPCGREDQPISVGVCFDCSDRDLVWAIRVTRVITEVESRLGVSGRVKVEKLTTLLKSEEWKVETPHLGRWIEKLGVVA